MAEPRRDSICSQPRLKFLKGSVNPPSSRRLPCPAAPRVRPHFGIISSTFSPSGSISRASIPSRSRELRPGFSRFTSSSMSGKPERTRSSTIVTDGTAPIMVQNARRYGKSRRGPVRRRYSDSTDRVRRRLRTLRRRSRSARPTAFVAADGAENAVPALPGHSTTEGRRVALLPDQVATLALSAYGPVPT